MILRARLAKKRSGTLSTASLPVMVPALTSRKRLRPNLIMSEPERLLPSVAAQSAEIIIIGGGAIGCGAAYALSKAGKTDILLLERVDDVGQATTSQGAG